MRFPRQENTIGGCHFLLQGIFLTRGWNPCLLHWQVDSLPLSHQGSPRNVKGRPWVSAQKHFWIFSSSSHLSQQAGGLPSLSVRQAQENKRERKHCFKRMTSPVYLFSSVFLFEAFSFLLFVLRLPNLKNGHTRN